MSQNPKQTPAPFSLRLSAGERAKLEAQAGNAPLGVFIRQKLLEDGASPRRSRGREPVRDHQLLGQLLGELGRSRLANNLNQLAKAANSGCLPVTPETESALQEACADLRAMRTTLLRALGLQVDPSDEPPFDGHRRDP